jgi:hypothetical protein
MPSFPHLRAQQLHLCHTFLPGGTAHQHETTQSRFCRDVGEPKEVKRFWPSTTLTLTILARETQKLSLEDWLQNHPGRLLDDFVL